MTTTILIVEESDLGNQLVEVLEMEGFVGILAMNGAEGMRLAQAHPPHLILTDFLLPGMNGIEFIKRIHALPALAKIPIIMMSGMADKQAEALEVGAISFLSKPFYLSELLGSIRQHCPIRAAV